jgi:hypothetical protein
LLKCRIDIKRVPENDDVDHESKGSKLVFLSFPIALTQFATFAVKNSSCQLVAVLATIQLSERPPAFRPVVNISKAVDGFVDAPEFGDSLSELRWAVINPKGSHDRRRLHHTQLQRSGQTQDIVPVLPNEIRVDAMPADAIQEAVVSRLIDSPVPGAANIGNPWTEPIAQEPKQAEHDIGVSTGIGHDLSGSELCLLFENYCKQEQTVS